MIYIFLFYTKSTGKQVKWTLGKYKHCEMLQIYGEQVFQWSPDSYGLRLKVRNPQKIVKLLSKLSILPYLDSIIMVERHHYDPVKWSPLIIQSCSDIMLKISLLDIPCSIFPYRLHKNLIKYNAIRNYTVLYHWSRVHGERYGAKAQV